MMAEVPWFFFSGGILALIIIIAVFVAWRTYRELKTGFHLRDERTMLIQGKAAIGTYYISIFFIAAELLFYTFTDDVFPGFPGLDVGYLLIAVMMVEGISFGVLSWFYGRAMGPLEDED
jgi:hypothetical protein